ncbi:MAG TPA: cisplatin damage response ATP-dependent DNA ligase [Patescibacteria group bacterium]|nr:cisplatin damage response ATP-dependent DNA ligase [Patescibacteria group bacterium]
MKQFAELLENLLLTPSRNSKLAHMVRYFQSAPDPDRGYALAALTGELNLQNVKANLLKKIALERVDEHLFDMSYDYVGDLAETIALIWPETGRGELPSLSGIIAELETIAPPRLPGVIAGHLTAGTPTERWAIIKLATGNLRIGVSARLAKQALADFSAGFGDAKTMDDIEHIWHGLAPPYAELFAWLENRGAAPEIHRHRVFHPMMLSHAIDEEKDFAAMNPADWQAEWKWDGIRVQLSLGHDEKTMFSRTGDNIAHTFPDLLKTITGAGVLDGELLVGRDFSPMTFNDLQQRLNRKTVSAAMQKDYPAFVRVYDMLFDGDEDIRHLPLVARRARLEAWLQRYPNPRLDLSAPLPFQTWDELAAMRIRGAEEQGHEGIMLKCKDSIYQQGRPKGLWYKWKRDPRLIDAILMYAQRGHGKRSSFYSDYTFGVWKGNEIVPVGKAYFGFTDEELLRLDKWIRSHTTEKFGPVREVEKQLVFEVAFDSAHDSPRHKSGVALRFPRINRIRWDKPAQQADTLESVRQFVT